MIAFIIDDITREEAEMLLAWAYQQYEDTFDVEVYYLCIELEVIVNGGER